MKRKGANFGPKVMAGKMKIKLCNVCLSIAYSLRGLELVYLNCMKVLYRVLLSSNMAEHLNRTNMRRAI